MDAGFIPLYVFTALLSRRNYNEPVGTEGRWRTFFPTDEETDKVLQAAWLTATTVGGMHIASLILDLYLVIVFRKISKLPPDMNPLEDNLTSRRKTKHKHKSSSVSAITPLTADEKRHSAQSGTTTLVGDRSSQTDPLMSEKRMSFMHTRTNSSTTYSPHTPNSARQSRVFYSQAPSAAQSRADLNRREDLHRRDEDSENETLAQRKSYLAQQSIKRGSRPSSMVSSKQDYFTPPSTADNQRTTGDISQESLQSDNWFVHNGSGDEDDEPQPRKPTMALNERYPMFNTTRSQGYKSVDMHDDVSDEEFEPPMMPQPLRMNPPTPPPTNMMTTRTATHENKGTTSSQQPPAESKERSSPLKRTHTVTTLSSEATFTRSPSRPATPKSRYYGDLKAAAQGIRKGGNSPATSPATSPTKPSTPNNLPSATKMYTTNSPMAAKPPLPHSPFSLDKKSFASVRRTGEAGHTPIRAESPRVVSRTGVDYDGRYDFEEDSDLGTPGRRREVSGKVAEEGRGGGFGHANKSWMKPNVMTYRKVSGVV
jgi:hypothetical protein